LHRTVTATGRESKIRQKASTRAAILACAETPAGRRHSPRGSVVDKKTFAAANTTGSVSHCWPQLTRFASLALLSGRA